MPLVARPRVLATELMGVVLTKFPTPLAESCVGHGDTTFAQGFLHVAVAQGEARGEPDAVTDDFTGQAVSLVALGIDWSGHVWPPILGFNGSWRGIIEVMMAWRRKESQQVDKTVMSRGKPRPVKIEFSR
jgi:hypothetical protein